MADQESGHLGTAVISLGSLQALEGEYCSNTRVTEGRPESRKGVVCPSDGVRI